MVDRYLTFNGMSSIVIAMKEIFLTPEYACWRAIRQRCENPKNPRYQRYGGRGIKMCGRWQSSFDAFLSDVGYRPSPTHSIDRIDNDGHYEPGNVRWGTPEQQRVTRTYGRGKMKGSRRKKMVSFAVDPSLLERLDVWLDSLDVPASKTACLERAIAEFLEKREPRRPQKLAAARAGIKSK